MQYLILAALVFAGLVVGVDAIRERAARRKALHVPGLVAAAVRMHMHVTLARRYADGRGHATPSIRPGRGGAGKSGDGS